MAVTSKRVISQSGKVLDAASLVEEKDRRREARERTEQKLQAEQAQKRQDAFNAFNNAVNPGLSQRELIQGIERNQARQAEQEAKRQYEDYKQSEQRQEDWKKSIHDAVMGMPAAGSSLDLELGKLPEKTINQAEAQHAAEADYFEQNRKATEDRHTMENDVTEVEAMSAEDRRLLETYAYGRNEWFDHQRIADSISARAELEKKYGKQKVEELAESWQRYQNAVSAEKNRQQTREGAGSGFLAGVGHSAVSVAANALGTLTAPFGYLQEAFGRTGRYQTLDPNNPGAMPGQYASAVRQGVTEDMGTAGKVLYQGTMGALDNLARIAMGGGTAAGSLGLAAMGSFGSTLSEASTQGATPAQAVGKAVLSAGIEVATEKVPLDELFKAGKSGYKGAAAAFRQALKQGGIEAAEEEISLLGNVLVDALVMREKSDYNQQIGELVANGMSYADAKAQADRALWDEAVNTALTSFVSGGAMSGAQSGGQYMAQRQQDNARYKADLNRDIQAMMQRESAGNATGGENATVSKMEAVGAENATTEKPTADEYIDAMAADLANKPEAAAQERPHNAQRDTFQDAISEALWGKPKAPAALIASADSQQKERPDERVQSIIDAAFPSALDNAVKTYQSQGTVSDSVAETILGKNGFVQTLQKEVGLSLTGTKAEQVQAVKNAIARLASKRASATMAETPGIPDTSTHKAPGEQDRFATHRLLNEDGTSFEAMGAASKGFTGKEAYYDLLTDDNVQAPRKDDARFVEAPKKDAQGRNISEFVGNAMGSSSIAESFVPTIERLIGSGLLSHDTRHTAEGLAKASARILNRGNLEETFKVLSVEAAKGVTSADLEDEAFLLVNYYQEMPGEDAQKKAAEAFVLLENFAHNSGGALVEIRNLFRRLDARTQLEAWKREASKLAKDANMKPEDMAIPDKTQQEFLDIANAEETAVTDAAKTLNRSSKQDAEAAAGKAAKNVLGRADMTPEQIGNLAGERTAKSATTTHAQAPTEDDLYSAIMTFIRSKKNPVGTKRRRNNALAALQRYYQSRDDFETAWQQARRRAEMELGNDERGYQILQQFLDTGGMAQDVMDAYDRRSVSRRAMKEAATATGADFNRLIASSIQDKQAALAKIQTYISENYGVSGTQAAEMANQIQESFFRELSERQAKRLCSLFAERGQTAVEDTNGILPAKFRDLYNLGAFDVDGFISRAALKRLFGADGLVLSREVLDEYGTTSELRKTAVEQKIVQEIADQLPTTLWDALNQWRYTAMLANPSTHARNMIGTFGMTLIQHGLRDNLAAALEIGTYYASGKKTARTKSFLNPVSKKDWKRAASAWNDYQNDAVSRAIKNGGKYGNTKARIEDAKQAWKINNAKDNKLLSAINAVLGVAESATDLNSTLMDKEDAIFGRISYSLALAGYMKANRLDHITAEARDYAIKQAQTATFHDDSFLYQKVKGVSGNKLGSVVAPFLKAPTNVTSRVVEYSPGSLLTACYDFVRAAKHDGKTSADVINGISTSIVGTALWGFGYWLAQEGLLRIGGSGSDEEKEYEERMGFEPWTMLIDGEYVDIRSLSPACVPVMTGAAIYEAAQKFDDGITFQEAMEAMYYIADPIVSTSPASNLDGFMYAIRGMDTMTTGELGGTIAAEMVESYVGQFIPAFLRRVVNAQDNTQRKSVSTGDPLQDFTQYIRSGLPGEREKMYTVYDPWGRPLMQDATTAGGLENWITGMIGDDAMSKINEKLGQDWIGTAARTLNVFPVSDVHTTDIDDGIKLLLEQGYSAYPTETRKYITIPGIDAEGNSQSEKVHLTTEQWDAYNQTRGNMSYQLAKQIMASPVFAAMGAEEQNALLHSAYDYADELGKQAALPDRYTADIGEHLAGLEGIQDITAAMINHEVSDNISDAIDGLAALWNAGRDVSGATAALEDAESAFDALDKETRKAMLETTSGRVKAFLNAKDAGISAEVFSQAFTKYYELGKQYEDESEAATHWESSLQEMVNDRTITAAQAGKLKSYLKYWRQIGADSLGKHTEYLDAGFSTDDALELAYDIDALVKEPGYADVRPIQKMEAIANADYLTESQRIKAMQMYMEDGQIQKMNSIMDEFNMTAAEYATVYRAHLPQDKKAEEIAAYRALGYSQAEAERIYRMYNPPKKK